VIENLADDRRPFDHSDDFHRSAALRTLQCEISRDEAAEAVGIDLVELAERQQNAAEEDLDWAFADPPRP
jgi:hypothetical protein